MPVSDPASTRSRQLADFLAEVTFDDRLLGLTEGYVLDTLACIVFGARQPWSRTAAAYALAQGGAGRSTVLGPVGGSTSPAMAAFANGAAGHAFELDDVHEEAISHPGAVVVPAALAMAEGEALACSWSNSRDFEISQFWQNLHARLQPAVPKDNTGVPGRKWFSGFFSMGSMQKPLERP